MIFLRLTISSFFISLIMVSLLILFFHFLLTQKKSHILFRADFLAIVLAAILLRLFFPLELFFTVTFFSTTVMTAIRDFLLFPVFEGIRTMDWLFLIWGAGCLFQLARYGLKMGKMKTVLTQIQAHAERHVISEYIPDYKGKEIAVYKSRLVSTPMVMGLKPAVYLPAWPYSEEEAYYILHHELQHIRHKDIWFKHLINAAVMLYWWFWPMYILRKQIDLFIEMRADSAVVRNLNKESYLSYMQSLLAVQKKQAGAFVLSPDLSTCFINDDNDSLRYRIDFLLQGEPQRKTKAVFLLLALLLPFLTNAVVIEPFYTNTPNTQGVYSEEDIKESYIIEWRDGTHTLVIQEKELPLEELPTTIDIPIIKQ